MKRLLYVVPALLALCLLTLPDQPQTVQASVPAPPVTQTAKIHSPVAAVVLKARPAVVHLLVVRGPGRTSKSAGVLIDQRGYIVAVAHALGEVGSDVAVCFYDGTKLKGRVITTDAHTGLALIRVAEGELPDPLKMAADNPEVGDTVIAIGHPLSRKWSATAGIISAAGRVIAPAGAEFDMTDILQTDAAVNPGNSGGPLLNLECELVAVVMAMDQDAQAIAYAVPVSAVRVFVGANVPVDLECRR